MSRYVFACFLVFFALAAPSPGLARTPVYASPDLQQMSVVDRIRTIEQTYRDQSGGRQIPDNQLEYYLDQVNNNGWTLSQVQQDIGVSQGNSYGGWRPSQGWQAQEVVCSSDSRAYRECPTPFYGRARVTQQLSKAACREGSNWGQRQGLIWVREGCRARFGEDPGSVAWSSGSGRHATCESQDGRYRECPVNFTGRAQIFRQRSSSACIYNRDWGQRFGTIWVSNGCRAEFMDGNGSVAGFHGYGNEYPYSNRSTGQKITCASQDGRYRECRTTFAGMAELSKKLSNSDCIANRDWGQRDTVIWVNNGCRAEFTDAGSGMWNGYRNQDNSGYGGAYVVSCASNDGQFTTCGWNRNFGQPKLLQQDSGSVCAEGQTWGYDYDRGVVWVDRGCRGRFGTR
jgi:hypothetical protein